MKPVCKNRSVRLPLVRPALCAFALLAGASCALAQGSTAPPPAQTPIVLQSQTHAILVSVTVKGKDGQPVPDLKREDFTVTDDGKARDFRLYPADIGSVAPPSPLPPGQFSNRFGEAASPTGMTAILIDAINTGAADQEYAVQQALRAVASFPPGERIAIYVADPTISILQDYTTDHDALVASLKRFRPKAPRWMDAASSSHSSFNNSAEFATIPNLASPPVGGGNQSERNLARMLEQRRIETTLSALRLISTHLSVPTRRNRLLWITSGFPLNIDTNAEAQDTVRAINDANVALYPVDARGLLPTGIDGNAMILRGFAEETGGQAYTARNDLDVAIREAVSRDNSTYLLAFYISPSELDGKFHKLRVSVDRPNLSLHYRSGYTATIDPNQHREATQPIEAALLDARDSGGIGIDGRVTYGNDRGGKSLKVLLTLDRSSLPGAEAAPGTAIQMNQMIVEYSAKGDVVARITETVNFQMPPSGQPVHYSQVVREMHDAKSLRVVLQDKKSGKMGSLTFPLGETARP